MLRRPRFVLKSWLLTSMFCAVLATTAGSTVSCGPAVAGGAVVSAAIAGISLNKAIERFRDAGTELIARGQASGDLLVTHAGFEIMLATRNLELVMNDQREKLVTELSIERQQSLAALERMVMAAQDTATQMASVATLARLDVREIVSQALPWMDDADFYLESIDGATALHKKEAHTVQVRGIGFGYSVRGAERYSHTRVFVGDRELPAGSLHVVDAHTLKVDIAPNFLEQHFAERATSYVAFRMETTIARKGKFLRAASNKKYEVSIQMMLLPRVAGELRVVQSVPTTVSERITRTLTRNVPRSTTERPFDFHDVMLCAADEKIVSVTYDCNGGGCGWCYPQNRSRVPEGYGPDYVIDGDGRRVTVYRHCDGAQVTIDHFVHIDRSVPGPRLEVSGGSHSLKFGERLEIDLDSRNSDGNYELSGSLVTGHQVRFSNASGPTVPGPVKEIAKVKTGDHYRLVISVGVP